MKRARAVALAGGLVMCAALPAPAQDALPEAWPAVGRISYGEGKPGAAICTGTLVAPELVLTAGHCLRHDVAGDIPPASIRFDAGLDGGVAVEVRRGAEVILSDAAGLAGDMGLLRLESPVTPGLAPPLALAEGLEAGEPVVTVAYRRDAPLSADTRRDCAALDLFDGKLGLDCPVVSGNSGAPVLVMRDGQWRVAGVIVAKARGPGPVQAVALRPDPGLAARIAAR